MLISGQSRSVMFRRRYRYVMANVGISDGRRNRQKFTHTHKTWLSSNEYDGLPRLKKCYGRQDELLAHSGVFHDVSTSDGYILELSTTTNLR